MTAESLLLDENLADVRIGNFSPLLRPSRSIIVVSFSPSVEITGMLNRTVHRGSYYSKASLLRWTLLQRCLILCLQH